MKLFRGLSLRQKQTLAIWVSLCGAAVVACFGVACYEAITSKATFRERLLVLSGLVQVSAASALDHHDESLAADILSTLSSSGDLVAGCLCTVDGRILARFHSNGSAFVFPPPRPDGMQLEHGQYLVYQRLSYKGKPVGVMCLQSRPVGSIDLGQYASIAAVLGAGCLAITLALSGWLQRLISGRLLDLARTARHVAKSRDYSLRVATCSHDEFGGLIDDFNEMLGQIQAQDVALHQAHAVLEERVEERTRALRDEIAERTRAEERLCEQVERISLVNQLTRAVVERADLASVFHVLLGHLEDRLDIDYGAAYILSPEGQEFVLAAHGPESAAVATSAGERMGETSPLTIQFLEQAQEGEIFQLLPDEGVGQLEMGHRLGQAGVHCAVVVPLNAEGSLLGALVVGWCEEHEIAERERSYLRALSEHVALAARQTQLYGELQTAYKSLHTSQQAALQQERLRALGQMASGIAHDINNALTPVLGFAELLERNEPGLTANGRRCLGMIKTAAEDITTTVGRMKEFYRQRKGDEPLVDVQLNKAVQAAVDLARPRWRDMTQQQGIIIDLRTELDPGVATVRGNESEIRQALVNLIINAVDALPQGGMLTVRTRLLPGDMSLPGRVLVPTTLVEVIDTGVGMDEETRRRCLEPFYSTKGSRGTGLGLAMVYGVMERHGGRIDIESAPGRGTTMRLVFPNETGTAAKPKVKTHEHSSTRPLKVLCIDDEPLVLQVMEELLASLGHQSQTAASGLQGLTLFRQAAERRQAFDVVITDLGMPGMDGRTLATQLKTEFPDTPIILLTGWGMFLNGEERLPTSVDHVLAKPPSISDIQRGLLAVTRNRTRSRSHPVALEGLRT